MTTGFMLVDCPTTVQAVLLACMDVRARGQGDNCPPKFGQNSGENSGKARRKKYLCKISGKSTPLPPLTKESPYAHACMDTADV